ncbi:hypothetical protein ATANTOWER_012550 [Ataeniobius toweri]|uniref:Uncharacterized protein n=1 Tax=Ataeniobius toweri TaxID=208326 RepID=A0ABU7AZC7_9TELE|nr:hypothetical protein [Ataeniobius toweri]
MPQHAGHPRSCTTHPTAPSRPAGQLLHQSEATSQSMLQTAWARSPRRSPASPQLADRAPKPGTEIQRNASEPERAETPVPAPDNPQDPNPNPNPNPDPNQMARSFSRPPTPDGKQRTRV